MNNYNNFKSNLSSLLDIIQYSSFLDILEHQHYGLAMANIVEKILTLMVGLMRIYHVQEKLYLQVGSLVIQREEWKDVVKIIVPEHPIQDKKILMEMDKVMHAKEIQMEMVFITDMTTVPTFQTGIRQSTKQENFNCLNNQLHFN